MESLTFFGASVEHIGVFKGEFCQFALISFRSYDGILNLLCDLVPSGITLEAV